MNNPFIDPNFPFHEQSRATTRHRLFKFFLQSSIADYHRDLQQKPENTWQQLGQKKALNLFHLAANHVPAYRKFLKKNHCKPHLIKTYADFKSVPTTDKPNYFAHYSLSELSWHGKLETANTISFSSGSTGKPFLWPRSTYQDIEGAFAFEHLLTSLFHIDKKSTLLVNCFSMGNYVAGVYVYTSSHLVAQKGYPLTVVSPGINYQDTFNIITKVIDQYEQIILCGYPPFIRDIIELGSKHHISWKDHHLKFFFASEFFSEEWRDNTLYQAGNKHPLNDSTNIYGTADSAIFAFETPTSILVRKITHQNPSLHQRLFNSPLTPTLVQYQPLLTFFEETPSELSITANSGLPLIRYNLKDQGKIISYTTIHSVLESHAINLTDEQRKIGIDSHVNLPFLAVTNRTDGAVSFYAITLFPEFIRPGLETEKLRSKVTGKFTLLTDTNSHHEPTLTIHVELKNRIHATNKLTMQIQQSISSHLRKRSAEYAFLEKSLKEKAIPKIVLHHKGQSKYFTNDIKHKWIIK